MWRSLAPEQKQPYENIAAGHPAGFVEKGSEDDAGAALDPESEGAVFTGHWGLGSVTHPLRAELMSEPVYSRPLHAEISAWISEIDDKVMHDEAALPYRSTTYDQVCRPMACKSAPDCKQAESLLARFRAKFPKAAVCEAS